MSTPHDKTNIIQLAAGMATGILCTPPHKISAATLPSPTTAGGKRKQVSTTAVINSNRS